MKSLAWLLLLAACDGGWHEDEPLERAVTSWRLVPALDDRVAINLEPRKITRHEHGVLTLGYTTQIVGPTLAVSLPGEAPLAMFATGTSDLVIGDTRAWLLQTEVTTWDHEAPSSGSPRAPFVVATPIDRASLAAGAQIAFAPALDVPIVLGDELYDVPVSGTSDIARAMFVRRRTADGGAQELHTGSGFAAAWCASGGGLVLAYQLADGALELASIHDGTSALATFAATRFDPRGIACDATADHVALALDTGIAVFDIAGARRTIDVPGATGPMLVRGDGGAVVSVRASDRVVLFSDATATTATSFISAKQPATPVQVGELAMFELEHEARVIDLVDGSAGPAVAPLAGEDSMFPFEMRAWRSGGGFVVQQSRYGDTDYSDHLERVTVVAGASMVELPVPSEIRDPGLHVPPGSRAYIRSYSADDEAFLYGFDLVTKTQVMEARIPLCDEALVLGETGCR